MSYSSKSPSIGNGQGMRPDVYSIVTDKVLTLLERGTVPWQKPWRGGAAGMPKNAISKKPYRGVNVFLLSMTSEFMGYDNPYWLTYKQAQQLGGNVRKGEKSTLIVFWKQIEVKGKEIDANGDQKTGTIPFLRYYNVFNVDQCENLDFSRLPDDATDETPDLDFSPIAACENIVRHFIKRPGIKHQGTRACYSPLTDTVTMPDQKRFNATPDYYSTLFHELTHSTGHKSRLNRHKDDEVWSAFGSQQYSKEELVAEMGAAFLCGFCEIENRTIDNSAAYIQGWMKRLRDDRKLIVQAAAQAQKSTDFIMGE